MKFPDIIRCGTKVTMIGKDYLEMEQILVSTNNCVVVGTSKCTNVSFNYLEGKKANVPQEVIDHIQNIEGKIFEKIKSER